MTVSNRKDRQGMFYQEYSASVLQRYRCIIFISLAYTVILNNAKPSCIAVNRPASDLRPMNDYLPLIRFAR